MLYRSVAILIVLFWLTMTGLLVRKETRTADPMLREIPADHVAKLLFLHEQRSELNIISDKLRLGRLDIQPRARNDQGSRVLEFAGHLQIHVPGGTRQRVLWDGELELEKSLATRRFRLRVKMHDPAEFEGEVVIVPAANRAHYELRGNSGTIEQQDFPLDEAGLRSVLQFLGVDPLLLPTSAIRGGASPEVRALQSSMDIRGERIDTYLVTVGYQGQTLLEVHISQLGRVLHAKTFLGYTLTPDDIAL